MTLTRFTDVINLSSTRTPDPLAAGIERYVGLEHMEPENLHIRSWGNVADGTTFTNTFKRGQVLFGKRRAYQRKVAVAEFDGVCSSDIYVFESKDPNVLLPDLVPFILQSEGFYDYAVKTSAGSLSPRTNWTHLAEYEFPLPPLDEQRRIADLLWAADDMIIRDEELLASLKTYKKALFESLIEKELANGAKLVKLGELMLRSPDSGHSPISVDRETGHFVLILSAVSINGYQRGLLKSVELTPEVKATKLQKGDFLISRSNTVELVGLVGIYDEDRNDISFPDTMMRLLLDDSKIDRYFLEQYLLSRTARRRIQSFAAGTSGSMKKINRSHIASLEIPLFSLEKQKTIMQMVQKCVDGISAAKDRCNKSQELKKTLLNNMLSA